jgi:hypothetical protein
MAKQLGYDGDMAFTNCNGKIYMRRTDLPLGTLAIYDPDTFNQEG